MTARDRPDRFHRPLTRRAFLRRGAQGFGAVGLSLLGGAVAIPTACGRSGAGALLPPDENGLMLLPGFRSRIVAVSGERVPGTSTVWHDDPDGGATFAAPDGGWVYASNSEADDGEGGVGVLRFDPEGACVAAYPILSGTSRNCAGGPTPWRTWLSCEELTEGRVYECDPFAPGSQGVVRPALGVFRHEAAAVDPVRRTVYLTEDQPDGLLYRFTPSRYPDLDDGALEAAEILDPSGAGPIAPGQVRSLAWHRVSDPAASRVPTRGQVPAATRFNGGEGCWYESGLVYFSTKGDQRVWRLDTRADSLAIVYDLAQREDGPITHPDNVFATAHGDVYVAQDGGHLQIVALSRDGSATPIVRLLGGGDSELTGPALTPDGTRLYFSSQRHPGTTYEVTGPFAAGGPAAMFGPPSGRGVRPDPSAAGRRT